MFGATFTPPPKDAEHIAFRLLRGANRSFRVGAAQECSLSLAAVRRRFQAGCEKAGFPSGATTGSLGSTAKRMLDVM